MKDLKQKIIEHGDGLALSYADNKLSMDCDQSSHEAGFSVCLELLWPLVGHATLCTHGDVKHKLSDLERKVSK